MSREKTSLGRAKLYVRFFVVTAGVLLAIALIGFSPSFFLKVFFQAPGAIADVAELLRTDGGGGPRGGSPGLPPFVVAHGVVELSVICLAGAAGIQLGEALVRPGLKTRMAAFRDAVRQAAKLLPLVALFLVGAGIIEGYVSPNDSYPLVVRVIVGVGYGILLWAVLSGRIWAWNRKK